MTTGDYSPFQEYLALLHAELAGVSGGKVATYIPELAKAAPESFGISFATVDGKVYSVGDSRVPFSMQSVSKPFAYGGALRRLGQAAVLRKVGVEPTGEAFNSIMLDERNNRPFNPMVNAGAIAIAALAPGDTPEARIAAMMALFSDFAGRPLEIDTAVYLSEAETGHRNRAIAWLMLNSGMIDRPPEDVLDLYFRQCALLVTTEDLAIMGATLANNGVNPRTGAAVLGPAEVRDVLTLMMSCGMYDYAGEWSYEVGLPAKSGVSGAILAVLPGQLSIAIWSPPLDEIGNSVRAIAACRRISADFGLHMFMNAATVEQVVRRETRADVTPSQRVRNPRERDFLQAEGHRLAIVELQGALYFASAERMIRQLDRSLPGTSALILDLRRLHSIDAAAARFLDGFLKRVIGAGITVAFADIPPGREVQAAATRLVEDNGVRVFPGLDAAIEAFEDILLDTLRDHFDHTRFSLGSIDLFAGLDRAQLARLEAAVVPFHFDAGQRILTTGEAGRMFFVLARGSVSVLVRGASGADIRVGCIGPGQFFGEMALLRGGVRTADVVADERVVCYGLTTDHLDALAAADPAIVSTIMRNMAREFANRLGRNNDLIGSFR